ncbi:MAG: DUF2934 domain-containing protein [Methylovulum miyakonense]|uniref:DUF2934 domain-containing protein n=1 Tax=Methylovulum miyakonense TaxID=645578 RepID=UPI003BB781D9
MTPDTAIDEDGKRTKIAELAYLKAEKRGFAAGYDMDDWLEAEQELSNRLHNGSQEG